MQLISCMPCSVKLFWPKKRSRNLAVKFLLRFVFNDLS